MTNKKTKTAFSKTLQTWIDKFILSKEPLPIFFKRALKDAAMSQQFLGLIVRNPRENKANFLAIRSAFAKKQDFLDWFYGKNGFVTFYETYMREQMRKAQKLEDILQIIPNFAPWALEMQFGSKFKIGQIPEEFTNEKDFLALVEQISKSECLKHYAQIKSLERSYDLFVKVYPSAKKIDWFNVFERGDFLRNLLKQKCGQPFKVEQAGKQFTVEFLANPHTNKAVFKITTQNGKLFILKMLPYNFVNITSDRMRKEHENQSLRADSTYSNSLLEFYLKLNGCPHAPKICCYYYAYEVALYEAETGELFGCTADSNFPSFNAMYVKDANQLGVYVNDIWLGNFIKSSTDGQIKIIDIGHASFSNPLTPGVPGLTFAFGNLCGRDYSSADAED